MKTARLFQDGKSQAVRIPGEFKFEGDEVIIKRARHEHFIIEISIIEDSAASFGMR